MRWIESILKRVRESSPSSLSKEESDLLSREPFSRSPTEWGLGQVHLSLVEGEEGTQVEDLQGWLVFLGYSLPRFGIDGELGTETLSAVCDYQEDHGLKEKEHALRVRGVGPQTYESIRQSYLNGRIKNAIDLPTPTEVGFLTRLVSEDAAGLSSKRKREWATITGITLHQTATELGVVPTRYKNVRCHLAVPKNGRVVLVNGLNQIVYHGNAFNSHTVGIEIDGHFEGVEGDPKTYWRPKQQPNRRPLVVTPEQVEATKKAIEWVLATVHTHGGKIQNIFAHRQSSKSRPSDPGSRVWNEIGLWAQRVYGLTDGGDKYCLGGYPIPKEWDPSRTSKYRMW